MLRVSFTILQDMQCTFSGCWMEPEGCRAFRLLQGAFFSFSSRCRHIHGRFLCWTTVSVSSTARLLLPFGSKCPCGNMCQQHASIKALLPGLTSYCWILTFWARGKTGGLSTFTVQKDAKHTPMTTLLPAACVLGIDLQNDTLSKA